MACITVKCFDAPTHNSEFTLMLPRYADCLGVHATPDGAVQLAFLLDAEKLETTDCVARYFVCVEQGEKLPDCCSVIGVVVVVDERDESYGTVLCYGELPAPVSKGSSLLERVENKVAEAFVHNSAAHGSFDRVATLLGQAMELLQKEKR